LSDIEGPKIEGLDPAAGSSIELPEGATSGSVTIKGRTEKGTKLTVQSKSQTGSTPIEVGVGEDGSFDTGAISATTGTSIYELVATDKTGNKTALTVNYTLKRKTAVQQQGIALSIDTKTDPDNLTLNWVLSGITTLDGVKVLYGKSNNLNLSNAKELVASGSTYTLSKNELDKNKTYYFQVCRYGAETEDCDIYSNTVTTKIQN